MQKQSLIYITSIGEIPHTGLSVEIKNRKIAFFAMNRNVYALEDRCTHLRVQITHGFRDKNVIGCPLHGALFDIATGKVLQAPAERDLQTYAVVVKDGEVYFDTDQINVFE